MYLKETLDFRILFLNEKNEENGQLLLTTYFYSDWSGDVVDRKSTMGQIFFLASSPISQNSRKQIVVALSSCEDEYISTCSEKFQALWLLSFLNELKVSDAHSVELLVDNKSTIYFAKNPMSHCKSKHIKTKFHFLRDQVNKGMIKLKHCRTEDQLADVLTKALKADIFKKLRDMLRVVCFSL